MTNLTMPGPVAIIVHKEAEKIIMKETDKPGTNPRNYFYILYLLQNGNS